MVERVESYEQWKEEGRRGFAQVVSELEEAIERSMKVHLKSWADRRPSHVDRQDAMKLAFELLPPEFKALVKDVIPAMCDADVVGVILPLSPEVQTHYLCRDITLTMSELVFDTLILYLGETALKLEGADARGISDWIEFLNETKEAENKPNERGGGSPNAQERP